MSDTNTTETFEEEIEIATTSLVNSTIVATAVGCFTLGSITGWYGNKWATKRKANKLAKMTAEASVTS